MFAEADLTLILLADYAMPLSDANLEAASGSSENAFKLKRLMCGQQGVFIISPEYNASIAPLLKNTLDWLSRVREGKEPRSRSTRIAPLRSAPPRTGLTAACAH